MRDPNLLAQISRDFFARRRVYRYNMRCIADMKDDEVILACHRYCEEQGVTAEFRQYRESVEAQYVYCAYRQDYITEGQCYDQQMIGNGFISPDALPDITIDRAKLILLCEECKSKL